MLLRVEIVPSNQDDLNSQSQSQAQSQQSQHHHQPLHINLNTASHHHQGILLQVGRKNSDLTFPNEKSVSRTHCRLRLISLSGASEGTEGDGDDDGENQPLLPRNKEEEEVCKASIDGLAVVLEDLGSKFGTKAQYSLRRNTSTATDKADPLESKSDSETDDDETDEDEQSHQANNSNSNSNINSSLLTANNSNSNSNNAIVVINKTLEKHNSIVLPALSIPHCNGNGNNNGNGNGNEEKADTNQAQKQDILLTTIIQCGNAQFRITRIPLFFCLSRTTTSEKKKIAAVSSSIGAYITPSFLINDSSMTTTPTPSTTHLIAPDRTSTAKMICAWTLSIPVVTSKFVLDFSERKEANSPLPNVDDYVPDGTLPMDNMKYGNDDGDENQHQPRKIFNDYVILSLMESEAETICKCGGATVKKLYRDDTKKNDVPFWQNDDFFEELVKETTLQKKIVCWLDCTSRKVKKGKEFLVKKMKEGQQQQQQGSDSAGLRLRCVAQSQVVEAITTLSTLKDIDGVELTLAVATEGSKQKSDTEEESQHPPVYDQSADSVDSTHQVQKRSESKMKPLETIDEINESNDKEMTSGMPSESQEREEDQITDEQSGLVSGTSNKSQSKQTKSSNVVVGGSINSKSNMKKKSSLQEDSQSSGWISSHNSSSKSTSASKNKRGLNFNSNEESQNSGWISSQKTKKSKKSDRKGHDENSQLQLESIDEEDQAYHRSNDNKRKLSLSMTSDGWYLAPKGNKRAKYRRDITDILIEQGGPLESAQTELSSLIVRKKKNAIVNVNLTGGDKMESTNQRTNRKDFKRFRKNSIIRGASEHSFNRIRFISLLPKESERQRELQASQSEHERKERAGDLLFADSSAAKKRGIKSYLKPSAKSSRRRG